MRVLVFGDSITQGNWDTEGGWVDRIRRHYDLLQIQDLRGRDEHSVFNLGVSADNTENILGRIEAETIARTRFSNLPAVIVQIGVNDASLRGDTVQVKVDSYKQNLAAIIEKVKPLSCKLVFVGSSACDDAKTNPVSWGDYYYQSEAIKTYEDVMAAVAKEHDVPFIPIFNKFTAAINSGVDILPDGLHPNNAGHELIANLVWPELDKLLKD